MIKFSKLFSAVISVILVFSLFGCKSKNPSRIYEKEDSAGTGYGTSIKSSLYIDDFYFLTIGTKKSTVEVLVGSAHYHNENNELLPVYNLQNGDRITITYDEEEKAVTSAEYTYSEDMEKESFFDILVDLEILKSPSQETTDHNTTNIQDSQNQDELLSPPPSVDSPNGDDEIIIQQTTQGEVFASGTYNFTLIEGYIKSGTPRATIISTVGKPNYFFSHNFKEDSYIIDCYNLNDGSKLYLDYGYERTTLRCAAIMKNGTISSIFDISWSEQSKPNGYTRPVSDVAKVNRLTKNMTPAKVYAYIGEPSWYEGTRASYNDVFKLTDGSYAYLSFGSAHNKLTSVSIKGADGTITVLKLN